MQCVVQSLDTKERTVVTRMIQEDGSTYAGPMSLEIVSGSVVVPVQAGGGLTPYVYCEFEGLT